MFHSRLYTAEPLHNQTYLVWDIRYTDTICTQ
uniref:Uncharacterized protein n=1 Tax=Anguilla anguilla TaxID=7936 RepID=A0A0E9RL59_ANGAN